MSGAGEVGVVREALVRAKAVVEAAAVEEEQLALIETPSAEEIAEAREELGPAAGRLAVLRHARTRGRPKGAKNKRSEDFARYLGQFGEDPAISTIRIASSSPEALMEASIREHVKVTDKGAIIRWDAPTLTYEGACALILRASEGLMPYFHSKRPVAVDMTVRGDFDLIEEITDPARLGPIEDAEYAEVETLDGGAA